MIPLVGTVQELEIVRDEAEQVIAEVAEHGRRAEARARHDDRAAAGRADGRADRRGREFFSFGTNDLTQTVWGFSRDDVEASFFTAYLEKGIFGVSPFETIDKDGVGSLVRIAVAEGRATRPDLQARRVRRARRRPGVGALLPRGGPGLRLLLAVPHPGGAPGGGPRRGPVERQRLPVGRRSRRRAPGPSSGTRYHLTLTGDPVTR